MDFLLLQGRTQKSSGWPGTSPDWVSNTFLPTAAPQGLQPRGMTSGGPPPAVALTVVPDPPGTRWPRDITRVPLPSTSPPSPPKSEFTASPLSPKGDLSLPLWGHLLTKLPSSASFSFPSATRSTLCRGTTSLSLRADHKTQHGARHVHRPRTWKLDECVRESVHYAS